MTETIIPDGMTEREYFEFHATEKEFLDWYCKQELPQYERPSVTVDMVAYCFVEGKIKLLLIRRKSHLIKTVWLWSVVLWIKGKMLPMLVSVK